MTQLENSANGATLRNLPAPTFLRVISACAMAAPLLSLIIAHTIAIDAQDQAELVVSSLEWSVAALALALVLRGLLQLVTPRLPSVEMHTPQMSRDIATGN